jgi:hypothetical protein
MDGFLDALAAEYIPPVICKGEITVSVAIYALKKSGFLECINLIEIDEKFIGAFVGSKIMF